jgi:DNA-directed RNA polymerase specialized sigma24 family protein
MLKQLSLKDAYWRKIAYSICKDKMLADDIVSEMYIKLHDCKKTINDFYVIVTMKNIFLQEIKTKRTTSIDLYPNITDEDRIDFNDIEQEVLDNVYWVAREYIQLNETMSLREIGKLLNTNHRFIFNIIKKEKQKWQQRKQEHAREV